MENKVIGTSETIWHSPGYKSGSPVVKNWKIRDDERPSHYSDASTTAARINIRNGQFLSSQSFHSHPEILVSKHSDHLISEKTAITGLLSGNKVQKNEITHDGNINFDKPPDTFPNLQLENNYLASRNPFALNDKPERNLKNNNKMGLYNRPRDISSSNPWSFQPEVESFNDHEKKTEPGHVTEDFKTLQPVYYSDPNSKADPEFDKNHLHNSLGNNLQQTRIPTQQQFTKLNFAEQNLDYFDGLSGRPHQFHIVGTQEPQASLESESESVPDEFWLNFLNQDVEYPQNDEIKKDTSPSEKKKSSRRKNEGFEKSKKKKGSSLKRSKTLPLASSNLLAEKIPKVKGFQLKILKEHNIEIDLLKVIWGHDGLPLSIDFFKRVEERVRKIQIKEVKEAIAYLFGRVITYMNEKSSNFFSMRPADLVPFFRFFSSTPHENIEDLIYKHYHSEVSNYNRRKFEMFVYQMRSLRTARRYDSFFPQGYYTGTKELLKSLEEQEDNKTEKNIRTLKNRKNFVLSIRKTLYLITNVINKVFLNDIDSYKFDQKQEEALEIFDQVFMKVNLACLRPKKDDPKNNKPQESFATESAEYLAKQMTIDISRGLLSPKIEASYLMSILKFWLFKSHKSFYEVLMQVPNEFEFYFFWKDLIFSVMELDLGTLLL
ncbi:expressed protein [Phakopsora pachyrhizi]|uniref:Expressed protein n=1 Tax=Phakopsora pachyrhizi TaxID=170000 RepID=A0AAV0BVX0_PHAPC|nr:expressed protein [Phakopsora pachyrhizi]